MRHLSKQSCLNGSSDYLYPIDLIPMQPTNNRQFRTRIGTSVGSVQPALAAPTIPPKPAPASTAVAKANDIIPMDDEDDFKDF